MGDAQTITANDTVRLLELRSNPYVQTADLLQVIWQDNLGKSGSATYGTSALSKIVFNGKGGDDQLLNMFNPAGAPVFYHPAYGTLVYSMLPTIEAHGGPGNDTLYGGRYHDQLFGDDGNDSLYGGDGNDHLEGGRDTDALYGGAGDDTYDFGNTYLGGGSLGYDTIYESSNSGTDALNFYYGNMNGWMNRGVNLNLGTTASQVVNEFLTLKLSDAAGVENVFGTPYKDVIRGNALANYICGGDGNDTLYGMAGNDTLDGGCHDDVLYAGTGKDVLRGGDGDDVLVSIDDSSSDQVYGEGGTDSFWLDWWNNWAIGDSSDANTSEYPNNWHGVKTFANGADKTLDGDNIADPGSGVYANGTSVGALWYKNLPNRPLFASSGPSPLDIDQGDLGDCWMLSTLGNAAKATPNSIRQTVADLGDGTYAVALGSNFYRVDADLPTTGQFNTTLRFAGLGQEGSIWVPIVEKAYAFYRTSLQTYGSLDYGNPSHAFQAIGCSGFVEKSFTNGTDALKHINSEIAAGKAVVVNINQPSTGSGLVKKHTYMVETVNYAWVGGVLLPASVTLRNPYAADANPNDGVNNQLITVDGATLVASMFAGWGIQSAWVA
jgi:hypothetical protein